MSQEQEFPSLARTGEVLAWAQWRDRAILESINLRLVQTIAEATEALENGPKAQELNKDQKLKLQTVHKNLGSFIDCAVGKTTAEIIGLDN